MLQPDTIIELTLPEREVRTLWPLAGAFGMHTRTPYSHFVIMCMRSFRPLTAAHRACRRRCRHSACAGAMPLPRA